MPAGLDVSHFGGSPADVILSANGLMEFNDMAQVYPADEDVIERAASRLLSRPQADCTWRLSDHGAGRGTLGATACVAWALIEAGCEGTQTAYQHPWPNRDGEDRQ